jgi:hypothetical protein
MVGDTVQAVSAGARTNGARVAGGYNQNDPTPDPPGQNAVLQQGVAAVPPGASFVLTFTTATTVRLRCASIPDDIASLFRLTTLKCGDREFILGTSGSATGFAGATVIQGVRGTNFNEFSQCASLVSDCCIMPGKPMIVGATNISAANADFEMVFQAMKLPETCP